MILPAAITIRTHHGVPFASARSLYGLSRLSVGWLRSGIAIERPNRLLANGRFVDGIIEIGRHRCF
jgi:hypothetical protein